MKLQPILVASALAVLPVAAGAYSVDTMSTLTSGASYDINSGPFFWGATYTGADGAGSVSFTFANTTAGSTTVGTAQGTVLQFSGQFDGVTVSWGNGSAQSVAPGQNAILNVSSLLAAGGSDTLTVSWGAVTGAKANIDIDVAAVPLPAGFMLLGTALVGLGSFAARRKSA